MKFILKASVFCFVSLLTWITTTSILARQHGGAEEPSLTKVQADEPDARNSHVESRVQTSTDEPSRRIELGSSGGVAEFHMLHREITVADGKATASMRVAIMDKREGMTYVWRLRVLDEAVKPIAWRVYDDQIFRVNSDQKKEVTFRDTITLPPGAKRIELGLYEVRPGLPDLSFLDNYVAAKGALTVRALKVLRD